MGSFFSKTSRPIKQVMEKTSSTPQIEHSQVRSKLDTNSNLPAPTNKGPASLSNQPRSGGVVGLDTNSNLPAPTNKGPASLSNQPRRGGVVGEIATQAAGVAIGTAIGRKLSGAFDDKKDESLPTETDNSKYNIDNQMKNEEITEDDSGEQGDQGDQGDQESYDDSD